METNKDFGFSITKIVAEELYNNAGKLIPENEVQIKLGDYQHLLSDPVHLIIQEVLSEHPLPYKLQDFQLLTLHVLGSKKNVILLAPTGSGKMICAYLGILVLQKVFGIEKGVGLGIQPLSAIMEEKLKGPLVKTGVITMSGDVKASIEENDAYLSDPLAQFKSGDITILLGHAELWLTNTAQDITDSLNKRGLVVGTFLEEFQMNLVGHLGSDFRFVCWTFSIGNA